MGTRKPHSAVAAAINNDRPDLGYGIGTAAFATGRIFENWNMRMFRLELRNPAFQAHTGVTQLFLVGLDTLLVGHGSCTMERSIAIRFLLSKYM